MKRFLLTLMIVVIFTGMMVVTLSNAEIAVLAEDVKVTDIKVTSGKAYKLGDAGIKVGTKYYIDRDFVVNALPKDIEGSMFIMTANDDKNSVGANFLTFTVDYSVIVWLAHDSRGEKDKGGTPAEWLSDKNGWAQHTDMKVDVSDANMEFFILWSKGFEKGQIILGGNADPPAAGQASNYLVIIKPGRALAVVGSGGKATTTWGILKSTF